MELTELDALPEGIEFDYRILGGFNSNAWNARGASATTASAFSG